MEATTLRSDRADAVVVVTVHAALWLLFFTGVALFVPHFDKQFAGWQMGLPALTEEVLALSRWVTAYGVVVPLALLPLLALDGGILFLLRRQPRTRLLGMLWSLALTALPLLAALLAVIGIGMPFIKFTEGMMK